MKHIPVTLYLIGFAGSGKYTIAKEIAKSGFKVVNNHLINNSIFSLLDLDGVTPIPESAWVAIRGIRKAVLNFVSVDYQSNYVFTNELLKKEYDTVVYEQVQRLREMRESLFVPIKLSISPEENKKRISSLDRRARFKSTNSAEIDSGKQLIDIDHRNAITIDVTHLSAEQAARQILDFVEKLLIQR